MSDPAPATEPLSSTVIGQKLLDIESEVVDAEAALAQSDKIHNANRDRAISLQGTRNQLRSDYHQALAREKSAAI